MLDGETIEFALVEILVVLWMGMTTDEVANIHRLYGVVIESQPHGEVACIVSLDDE